MPSPSSRKSTPCWKQRRDSPLCTTSADLLTRYARVAGADSLPLFENPSHVPHSSQPFAMSGILTHSSNTRRVPRVPLLGPGNRQIKYPSRVLLTTPAIASANKYQQPLGAPSGRPLGTTSLFLWLGWGCTKAVFICRIYKPSAPSKARASPSFPSSHPRHSRSSPAAYP
jgi:hypothetical protein